MNPYYFIFACLSDFIMHQSKWGLIQFYKKKIIIIIKRVYFDIKPVKTLNHSCQ